MRFILFVGSGNSLAGLEVAARIPSAVSLLDHIFEFDSASKEEAISLVSSLGSALKLAEMVKASPDPAALASSISKKNFSVSDLNNSSRNKELCETVKKLLTGSRFILSKDYFGVSPVVFTKNDLDELLIGPENKVYKTVWVHDFRHWIQKDRELPFANAHAGILPPKIARSMVNLVPGEQKGKLLADPFCGSGRILVEAAEIGFKAVGLDISEKQVTESKANLEKLGLKADIQVGDATHLSQKFTGLDCIVTEPFLGKPNLRPDQVDYAVSGLKKLYLGCLKDWYKALKDGGYIVMVFPILRGRKGEYHTADVIDSVKNISYNRLARTTYSRPEAHVKREIIVLQKS